MTLTTHVSGETERRREGELIAEAQSLLDNLRARIAAIAMERDRIMRALEESRARFEAELADTKMLQTISAAMIHEDDIEALYETFVDAGVRIMNSDCGTMQMFFPQRGESGELLLLTSHGLSPQAQTYWRWVSADAGSTCAESLRTRKRTIADDYETCDFALRCDHRAAFREAGIRAAQSTPLISRRGEILGMITTHWKHPHRPSDRDLQMFDILARQAADVLERRLAEKALRESEQRFRAFVATSSDAIYRMSADWSEMRRLEGGEFIADTLSPSRDWMHKYIHPDDQARIWASINEAIAAKTPFDAEHRVIRIDGTLGWTHSRAVPLLDESGEITEWFGAATDITLKKQAEAQQKRALRESQRMIETFQTAFLPQSLPKLERVRFDAAYVPAGEGALVGGDWYDAAQLPDGRILLCVGDVTGHGLAAAVTAGKLRQAATVAALTASEPAEVLDILNRVLRFQNQEVYATAIFAFLNPECTELSYASAGHPPAFLTSARSSTVTELQHGGLPLGVAGDLQLRTHRVFLPEDFVLGFYSDGLTEFARDISAAEAKIKRAMQWLSEEPPVQEPANAVLSEVLGDRRPFDDVVLLIAQRSVHSDAFTDTPDTSDAPKTWRFHSSDESAAGTVRAALRTFTGSLGLDSESGFAAQIILGEALANAVQHAPGMVEVTIGQDDENLLVAVRDQGPGMKRQRRKLPYELLQESGRGLFLMHALAERVTVRSERDRGTELRALLPLARKAPSS